MGIWEDREKRLKDVPRHRHKLFKRAYEGKSRRDAVKAFCFMCMGYQQSEVDKCECKACPLWLYRNDSAIKSIPRKPRNNQIEEDEE